jgi:hypothetical protein
VSLSYATFRVCASDFFSVSTTVFILFLALLPPCGPFWPCLLLFLCVFLPTVFSCRGRGHGCTLVRYFGVFLPTVLRCRGYGPLGVREGYTVLQLNGVKITDNSTVHLMRAERAAILARNLPTLRRGKVGVVLSLFGVTRASPLGRVICAPHSLWQVLLATLGAAVPAVLQEKGRGAVPLRPHTGGAHRQGYSML